jgi:hypothetical protein
VVVAAAEADGVNGIMRERLTCPPKKTGLQVRSGQWTD